MRSSFERVVGRVSEKEKRAILNQMAEIFDEQFFQDIRNRERDKTPEEMIIISLANKTTNDLRKKYGLEPFNVPRKNIHIIKKDAWPNDTSAAAVYVSMHQGVAIRESPSKLFTMSLVLHEMIHFKSYNAIQAKRSGETLEANEYRVGLTVHDLKKPGKRYFRSLNEAITEELTKSALAAYTKHRLFSDEVSATMRTMKDYAGAVKTNGKPLFSHDTFLAYALQSPRPGAKTGVPVETIDFAYKKEREFLYRIIEGIFKHHPDKFKDKIEIFDLFAKAMMTGNLLPIGKLVEDTYGKGSFRRIGEWEPPE